MLRGGAHEHGYSAARRHSHDSDEDVMLPMPVTAVRAAPSGSSGRGFLGCLSWNRRTLITVLTLVVITVFLFSLSGSAPAPSRRGSLFAFAVFFAFFALLCLCSAPSLAPAGIDEELRNRAGRGGTVLRPRDDDGLCVCVCVLFSFFCPPWS